MLLLCKPISLSAVVNLSPSILKLEYLVMGNTKKYVLKAAHMPGVLNTDADLLSRKTKLRTEKKLNESIFSNILEYFDFLSDIGIFAIRIN